MLITLELIHRLFLGSMIHPRKALVRSEAAEARTSAVSA
jgi:hypothetical protein